MTHEKQFEALENLVGRSGCRARIVGEAAGWTGPGDKTGHFDVTSVKMGFIPYTLVLRTSSHGLLTVRRTPGSGTSIQRIDSLRISDEGSLEN
ncbi:MAG: hypothetical protein CMJ83_14675 [Planctomycetes bacterium]|nr:hypothetical protein [Planctomycetota bacterium]